MNNYRYLPTINNKVLTALLSTLTLVVFVSANVVSAERVVQYENGPIALDSKGKISDAHDRGITKKGCTYYMFGTSRNNDNQNYDNAFKAINVYSSQDLVKWKFRGKAFTPGGDNAILDGRVVARPHVIYNKLTRKWVMWFRTRGRDWPLLAGVATSDKITGPYKFLHTDDALGVGSGDETLFVDDDGQAYFLHANGSQDVLYIDRLSADFTRVEEHVQTFNGHLEAPQMFKQDGRYYLIVSGLTGWRPNQSRYSSSTSLDSGWEPFRNLGDGDTYSMQGSDVVTIQGSETTTHMLVADRWNSQYLGNSRLMFWPLRVEDRTVTLPPRQRVVNINLDTGVVESEARNLPTPPAPGWIQQWLFAGKGVNKKKGKVNVWFDQSGNYADVQQSTASRQPTFIRRAINGHPVLRFDGVDDYMAGIRDANGGGFESRFNDSHTFFMVMRLQSNDQQVFSAAYSSANLEVLTSSYQLSADNANGLVFQTNSGGPKLSVGAQLTDAHLYTAVVRKGNRLEVYRDGVSMGTQALSGNQLSIISAHVFGRNRSGNRYMGLDVAETLLYRGAMNDANRSQVENYLMDKYAIGR